MKQIRPFHQRVASEIHFWACFAVVMALFSQVLFPPQVMAAPGSGPAHFILCGGSADLAPVVDVVAQKLFASHNKSKPYQGLKCANCLVGSITGLSAPTVPSVPASYAAVEITLKADPARSPVQARAPPRPFSCGPPSNV